MERKWHFLVNQFLVATATSFKKALYLAGVVPFKRAN